MCRCIPSCLCVRKFFQLIRNISVKLRFKNERGDAPLLDSNELTSELGNVREMLILLFIIKAPCPLSLIAFFLLVLLKVI